MNAILPTADNSRRIVAIDGFRALAITMVMLHHAVFTTDAPEWLRPIMRIFPQGVFAFWVLSGFLITRSILLEEKRRGAIQFRFFYSRQAIRFFVPMVAYLIPIAIFVACRAPELKWWVLFRPVILDPNTYCVAQGVTHLYSLVMQIYFWLAWPVVLKLSPPRLRLPVAIVLSLAALTWKIFGEILAARSGSCVGRIDYFFPAIVIGSSFALAQPWIDKFKTKFVETRAFAAAIIAAILVLILVPHPVALLSSIIPAVSWIAVSLRLYPVLLIAYKFACLLAIYLAWGFLVSALMNNALPRASRVLGSPALTWLGRISFSVYLWQTLFCFGLSETFLDRFPINIFASILLGYFAYRIVELPSLRWRSTIKKNATSA